MASGCASAGYRQCRLSGGVARWCSVFCRNDDVRPPRSQADLWPILIVLGNVPPPPGNGVEVGGLKIENADRLKKRYSRDRGQLNGSEKKKPFGRRGVRLNFPGRRVLSGQKKTIVSQGGPWHCGPVDDELPLVGRDFGIWGKPHVTAAPREP